MTEETIILGQNTPYPLKGMLTIPTGAGPFPALVLVHGSGSSNMDEKVGKLTPFKDLAQGLAERGIASIRYDKRSYTHGLKMFKEGKPITVREEVIEDALLAKQLLMAHSRIDPERIFLAGHSMGGMLAPRIECEGGNFRGLILLAGSPRSLDQIMLAQIREIADCSKGLAKRIMEKQLAKYTQAFRGLYELTDAQAQAKKMGGGTTLYYFKEMGRPTVAQWLEKTRKPMLVMQGEKDVQVKAGVDFARYKELLGDRENVAFKLYPGLNHAFVPARFDSIAQAKKEFTPERHIGAQVLDDIANWIHAQ